MATGYLYQGTDIANIYGAKGATKASDTGFKTNGVDISNALLAIADGKALGFNTNFQQGGTDLSAKFGIPTGNTPLPINGNSYAASAQSGTTSSVANLVFGCNNTGWVLSRTQTPGSSGTIASGSNPSGATAIAYNLNVTSSTTSTSSSNAAPSQTSLTGTLLSASIQANGAPSQPEHDISAVLTIYYYNSSNNIISTTTINLTASATGSS